MNVRSRRLKKHASRESSKGIKRGEEVVIGSGLYADESGASYQGG